MKYKGFYIEQAADGFTVFSKTGAILGTFGNLSEAYDSIDSL